MPLSNSVLRRYTPPTCTLEIRAKSSPLSRWVGQSVLKDLHFELRFDDPRKPEEKRVTIRGDRTDLEVLYDAVNSYVQNLLDPSPREFSVALHTPAPAKDSIPHENQSGDAIASPTSGIAPSESVAAQTPEKEPNQDLRNRPPSPPNLGGTGFTPPKVGGHRGPLEGLGGTGEQNDGICVSPTNESDDSSSVRTPGLGPKMQAFKPRTPPKEIYLKAKGLVAHDLFLGQLANEESGSVIDLSVLQLFDLATALDEYAAEVVALPTNLKPLSWKKTPAAWTGAAAGVLLAVGVTTAGVRFLNQPKTQQEAAAPTAGQQPSPTASPPLISQVPPASPSPLPTPVVPTPLASAPKLAPPPPVTVPIPPTRSLPSLNQPQILSVSPSPERIIIPPGRPSRPAPARVPNGVSLLPGSSVPSISSSRSSPETAPAKPSTPSAPTTPPPLPTLPTLQAASPSPEVAPEVTPSPSTRSLPRSADLNRSEPASVGNAADNTLFDNIPQVAEARNYLQQRWKPPSGLTQTLEYSLLLNEDGSIQRIIPLGQAAQENIDKTDIPLPGQPFVSAVEGGKNPIIRVVFTPDGKVKTLLER